MKKSERLELIKKIVAENAVETQHDLLKLLEAEGLTLTQATISRDMNEIGIIKVPSVDGPYIYGLSKDKTKKVGQVSVPIKSTVLAVSEETEGLENMINLDVIPGNSRLIKRFLLEDFKDSLFSVIADDDSLLVVAKTAEDKKGRSMLLEISIKNFAIIEEISLTFENGMTVLTGETGAGKSIIIDAMNLMLGARASLDVIRHGANKAEIEGLFSVGENAALTQILEENGIEVTEELIIRREILQNGRSIGRINGQMVNLTTLRAVGQYLVDIHGQHDQEELMKPNMHIRMLDEFGDSQFASVKKHYQDLFEHYRRLRKRVLTKQKNEQEHKARIEMLEFQIAEIEAAALKSGEDQALNQKRDKLLNHKHIADTLTNAYVMLDDEEFSSLSNIRSAMNDLMTLEEFDADYKDMSSNVSEAYYILEEVTKQLSDVIDELDFDAGSLQQIEARLEVIHSITRKYGGSVDDVLDYYENITKEYNLLTGNDESSDDMEKDLKRLEKELIVAAENLSQERHQLAKNLEAEIKQELADLYMEKADFQVQFSKGKFNRDGNEAIEFYISTNPGEGFKPLVKVASGGEISRLMLAIKSAFSRKEDKTSIVFDEVDTGVSGRVAQAIAQKIYKIGSHGQVLAISHLPQVIAIADYQFFIEKRSDENTTVSTVRLLSEEERVEEIAKMLAGSDITEMAREQARELLKK